LDAEGSLGGSAPSADLSSADATGSGTASFSGSSGDYTIKAAGADIWTWVDEYGALYEPGVTGDVMASVTIESQEDTDPWAKSGLAVANDATAAGSSAGDVVLATTPGNGYTLQWDADGDGYVDTQTNVDSVSYPCELRLTKSGSEFTGEYSTDGGSTWTPIETVAVDDAATTQDVGMVVTSHDSGTLGKAEFAGFGVN
jgi:hypothetical protein